MKVKVRHTAVIRLVSSITAFLRYLSCWLVLVISLRAGIISLQKDKLVSVNLSLNGVEDGVAEKIFWVISSALSISDKAPGVSLNLLFGPRRDLVNCGILMTSLLPP